MSDLQEQFELQLYIRETSWLAGRESMLQEILKLIDTKTYYCKSCKESGEICAMDKQKNEWYLYIKTMTFREETNES